MRFLDVSLRTPEENLALDEVLLDGLETGRSPETLRVWESATPVVVLGVSQSWRQHVYEQACRRDGVKIMRRCSAGGCVLIGPGSLNFSLVLLHSEHPQIKTLRGSYCYILGAVCEQLRKRGVHAHHKGISDIAVSGKKVSGSAQKRRKNAILHQGTLLYNGFNSSILALYLREPPERPQYRGTRSHEDFVHVLPMSRTELCEVLRDSFHADGKPERLAAWEMRRIAELAREKYASLDWSLRR